MSSFTIVQNFSEIKKEILILITENWSIELYKFCRKWSTFCVLGKKVQECFKQ